MNGLFGRSDRRSVLKSLGGVMLAASGSGLTEIMPRHIRSSGFSLAYSFATAIFGGFTPALCTYLIHETHNQAMPGIWLSTAALVGLIAATILRKQSVVLTPAGT